ncbi:MAG: NADPH-dependent ferric siderophore reductase [Shinella sp.]|nr:MAG: NADPH-dependent ferric siderophore reductase [Shinella sp.]
MDNHVVSGNPVSDRMPKRVRHEIRVRSLDVVRVCRIAPNMVRVTLTGEELHGFTSAGFDDHVKMFFPGPGQTSPDLPFVGPKGIEMPEGLAWPIARDYTPRRYDPEANELDIDFAIHENGPATQWAVNVKAGDRAWIGGPRGSFVVPFGFDWHLLIGDETALPAIARRLEELPAGSRAVVIAEVENAANELELSSDADVQVVWVHRGERGAGEAAGFTAALEGLEWPGGDYHAWISCESLVAKSLRTYLIDNRGANPKWMRASGYWRRGAAGMHDHFDE